MPIRFQQPPSVSDEVVRKGLNEVAQTHRFGIAAETIGGAIDTSNITSPHIVFSARLDNLRDGKGVESAQPESWRYFVGSRSAEVGIGGGRQNNFLGVNTGPFNEGMQRTLQSVESDPRVQAEDFECRLLRVNALSLAALWLKNKGKGDDLIIPLGPAPAPFVAEKIYGRTEYNELLTKAARSKRDLEPPVPLSTTG